MLAPESVPSPRPERCPRDVPLELTARHGLGCREREQVRARALLEHDPDFITRGPRAGEENEDGSSRNIVDASVVLGSSERESDDSVSVDTNTSHSTDLSLETAHLPAGSKDMGNGWIWDASIQRFMKKERTMKKEERVAKWVQTATGAWEQATPKRLPVEPDFDEMQTGITARWQEERRRRRRSLELQRGGSEKVGSTRLHHGLRCKWQRQAFLRAHCGGHESADEPERR